MPCTNCSAQFGVFKRKKQCHECRLYFCSLCLKRDRILCQKCTVLTARPLSRSHLLQLKTRDLIIYLKSIHVSTSGCVEKEDLVNLLMAHVNNSSERGGSATAHNRGSGNGRPQSRSADESGNLFRQFNLQNIWATVQERYDNVRIRPFGENRTDTSNAPANPNPRTYTRTRPPYFQQPTAPSQPQQQNPNLYFNDMPSGTSSSAAPSPRVPETSDIVEIEDIGDWEFVSRTGETLSDSDPAIIADAVQSNENDVPLRRTTSEGNISTQTSSEIPPSQSVNRSMHNLTNLNEEHVNNVRMEEEEVPIVNVQQSQESLNMQHDGQSTAGVRDKNKLKPSTAIRERVRLSDIREKEDLEDLSVKQLKELLVVNRVDFKGCCEKNELLERVSRLWNEHSVSRENLEQLPFDDLCKICMDAPVECVMLECGHIATCTACGKQLSECPICRQYVVRVVRIFKA